MPLLPEPFNQPNIKQIFLPKPDKNPDGTTPVSLENKAWVEMDVQPTTGADITQGISSGTDPFGMFLTRRIRKWNFNEDDGTPTPITYENVLRMGKENIAHLAAQPLQSVDELTDEQKKTSTSTSTQ